MLKNFTEMLVLKKNTPEIRHKLDRLGYGHHYAEKELFNPENPLYNEDVATKDLGIIYLRNGVYSQRYMGYSEEAGSYIDCGTNEAMFFSLAALRSDTDYGQWFTNSTYTKWFIPGVVSQGGLFDEELTDEDKLWRFKAANFHKATPDELIKHFKDYKEPVMFKMKSLYETIPEASKIIDDNFWNLI